MSKPTVAIIIPAYNEEAVIEKCLESCINQASPADEIIVVNNNSKDATVKIVEAFQKKHSTTNLKLIHENTQGLIAARNRGFKEAKSDILGRIDADSLIDPNWTTAVREVFQNNTVAAATGPVVYHDMPLRAFGKQVDETIRSTLHKYAKDHYFLFGSNMAVRRSVWEEIVSKTSLDPNDELHEDVDIALTLFDNNYEVAYAPDMVGGMSARRLEDKPRDFYQYLMRFERTFKVHNVKSKRARIPIFIYLLIYFPIRTVRKFYDSETRSFTLQKIRDEITGVK